MPNQYCNVTVNLKLLDTFRAMEELREFPKSLEPGPQHFYDLVPFGHPY